MENMLSKKSILKFIRDWQTVVPVLLELNLSTKLAL